ncbi:hypothetical protein BJ546DRAFT_1112498 [Cryomyces antarcticus]
MIAVQSLTGEWYRRIRDETDSLASYIPGIYPEELDPPAGYTVEFYQEYLQRQNLPSYFLAPGHIAMRQNNEEAEALGIPGADAYRLIPEHRFMLERLYPHLVEATNYSPWCIVVHPDGCIPAESEGTNVRDTQRLQSQPNGSSLPAGQAAGRLFLIDPQEQPNGPGRWEFFAESDRQTAETDHSITSAAELFAARRNSNPGTEVVRVVWFPNRHVLNAAVQPDGEGSWHVWEARRNDPTCASDINIIWTPARELTAEEEDPPELERSNQSNNGKDTAAPDDGEEESWSQIDIECADKRIRTFTVDRGAITSAKAPRYKMSYITSKGELRPWSGTEELRGTKDLEVAKKLCDKLNKFLDREFNRHGWVVNARQSESHILIPRRTLLTTPSRLYRRAKQDQRELLRSLLPHEEVDLIEPYWVQEGWKQEYRACLIADHEALWQPFDDSEQQDEGR